MKFMWYSNDMFNYILKVEFVVLASLKVPSGYGLHHASERSHETLAPPGIFFF